ncbi:MAG: AAA family ATPase [Gammaproteobacteria bacterium]|nr:AAA family ATPase [Gammaproteobacteria bacterium]
MAPIDTITVRGFKSIRELQDFEIRPLNILIGPNGSGKSNLMAVFRMLRAIAEQCFQSFVSEEDGADSLLHGGRKRTHELQVAITFDLGRYRYNAIIVPAGSALEFAVQTYTVPTLDGLPPSAPNRSEQPITGLESALSELGAVDSLSFPHQAMHGWQVYHFQDTSRDSPLRRPVPTRDNIVLRSNGGNLASFLRHIRERYPANYRRIADAVRLAAPFFGDFSYREEVGESLELEWFHRHNGDRTPFGPRQLSDGTLRFICLATLLHQPEHLKPNPIFIDEPELGLHPFALTLLAEMLESASESRQIVVSTQSADLVSEFAPEDVVTVSRKDGESLFERLEADNLREWLEDYSLGDLWRAHVVGSGPTP